MSVLEEEDAMKIAVTRLKGKDSQDALFCARFGHTCYSVSPLRAVIYEERIASFIEAVEKNAFDCLFFASALPAAIIAPRLSRWPRVIAIGPQTARTLNASGVACEVLPGFYSRDLVPYLGEWIRGKRIGIPRADIPNKALIDAINREGGIACECRCYGLVATEEELNLEHAEGILFTSAESFRNAIWKGRPDLLVMAIGEITAALMREAGIVPEVIGDGSLEGSLEALNRHLAREG
jgi:uroporphyrinogen-III synthase